MPREYAIEFASIFSLPPVPYVELAADLGCRYIGISLEPRAANPHHYPHWSLRNDAALRREMTAAMRDRGVAISIGQAFLVRPGTEIADAATDMDIMAQLGTPMVNMLSLEPDMARGLDQCAVFAGMAEARGMRASIEFLPGIAIDDLSISLAAVRHVGSKNFGVVADVMHLVRSGSSAADIAAAEPDAIAYLQICDVPMVSPYKDYAYEASCERLAPGDGELPLAELLGALSPELIVGIEVPMLARAEAGVSPYDRLSPCVAATRRLCD